MSDIDKTLKARERTAEEWTNAPGTSWQDLFLSRFVGQFPEDAWDVPMMLTIEPTTLTRDFDGKTPVKGFFEMSSGPPFANLGGFEGTLDVQTRKFVFRDLSPSDALIFTGSISQNGRIMHLAASKDDGADSGSFFLIHEETFDAILASEEA